MLLTDYIVYLISSCIVTYILAEYSTKFKIIREDAKKVAVAITYLNLASGLVTFLTYVYFVLSSSLMTKIGKDVKLRHSLSMDVLGRSWRQVVAVGLMPGLMSTLAVLNYVLGSKILATRLVVVALTMYAMSTADTWASELGILSKTKPRLILGLCRAEVGTSGAVSLLGSLASVAGSLTVALISTALLKVVGNLTCIDYEVVSDKVLYILLIVFLCGYVGEVVDSILGLFLQEKRQCLKCGLVCEQEVHCNFPTVKLWGFRKVCGEHVNMMSQCIVGITSFLLTYLLF